MQEASLTESAREPRKPRVDAQRNRERLLETARAAFARDGDRASLDDIAKKAGVGSATLYRHYPTRERLIEAVYHREVEKLGAMAEKLSASKSPMDALRTWLLTFVDHVIEKNIIAAALSDTAYETASVTIQRALQTLVARAVAHGDLHQDTIALDFLRAVLGVLHMRMGPGWQDSARRLVDILLQGATKPR